MTEIISKVLLFFFFHTKKIRAEQFKNLHSWFPCSKFIVWKSQIIYLCYTYIISNFSTLDFHIWKIKKSSPAGNSNFQFLTVILYPHFYFIPCKCDDVLNILLTNCRSWSQDDYNFLITLWYASSLGV